MNIHEHVKTIPFKETEDIYKVISKMEECRGVVMLPLDKRPVGIIGEERPYVVAKEYCFFREVTVRHNHPILKKLDHPTIRMSAFPAMAWDNTIKRGSFMDGGYVATGGVKVKMWGCENISP